MIDPNSGVRCEDLIFKIDKAPEETDKIVGYNFVEAIWNVETGALLAYPKCHEQSMENVYETPRTIRFKCKVCAFEKQYSLSGY